MWVVILKCLCGMVWGMNKCVCEVWLSVCKVWFKWMWGNWFKCMYGMILVIRGLILKINFNWVKVLNLYVLLV